MPPTFSPNFEKVGRAYCFRLVCVSVCERLLTYEWCMLYMDLTFYVCIPHEKIVDSYLFFSCLSYAPLLVYVRLKTKFENLVCKIS